LLAIQIRPAFSRVVLDRIHYETLLETLHNQAGIDLRKPSSPSPQIRQPAKSITKFPISSSAFDR
jgi:hypothetical protein